MSRKLALPLFLLTFALCVIFASRTPQPIIEELPPEEAEAVRDPPLLLEAACTRIWAAACSAVMPMAASWAAEGWMPAFSSAVPASASSFCRSCSSAAACFCAARVDWPL